MKRLITLLGATVMLWVGLAAPARAAVLSDVTRDCGTMVNNIIGVRVMEVGDTFNLFLPNCLWSTANPAYVSPAPTAGDPVVGPVAITAVAVGTHDVLRVTTSSGVFAYVQRIRVSAAPAPAPATVDVPPPPPPPPIVHQGLPMPEAGCEAVKDEEFAWGSGLTGGWVKSWQTWRRDDGTVFHDGYACIRSMEHTNGAWRLIDAI